MVQESRAQVNAAGGPGADRPAARRKKRRPCGKARMPPSVITGRRGIPLRPGGMKKKRYFHWMRCTVAGPYSTVRA